MINHLRNHMKGIMLVIVIAFLASTFLMYERSGSRRTPTRNPDGSMSDYEVAQINGKSLMRSELERRLRNYLQNYESRNAVSLDMPAVYQAVLDQAVLEAQLDVEIRNKGIVITDAQADAAMKEYADTYYPTRETFYQYLAQIGIKIDDYKKNLAHQMATQQLIRSEIGDIVVSNDKAVEFYDSMKGLIYTKPEGFLIHLADFNNANSAEIMRSKLLSGDSWLAIVSSDALSPDIINITREPVFLPSTALNSGTLQTLASTDVGQVSNVFEITSTDFAVGLKTEHVQETITSFDEVSSDILQLLRQQEERKKLNDYEAALMAKAQLVIHDTSLFPQKVTPTSDDVKPQESTNIAESEDISETKSEEIKTEETKPEQKPEVTEPATQENQETKPEEIKTEEAKPEQKPEVTEPATQENQENKTEEIKTEEVKQEAVQEKQDNVIETQSTDLPGLTSQDTE